MNDPSNYHWTEDLCTNEGLALLSADLAKQQIGLKDKNSAIYKKQRMGKQTISFDLTLDLLLPNTTHRITGYTSLSSPEDLDDFPQKSIFLSAIEHMKQTLLSTTTSTQPTSTPTSNSTSTHLNTTHTQLLTKTAKKATTEKYTQTFTLSTPIDHAIHLLFTPNLVSSWSAGQIQPTPSTANSFTYTHPALIISQLTPPQLTTPTTPVTITTTGQLHNLPSFPLTITLTPVQTTTEISFSSPSIPIGTSNRLTALFTSLYFQPLHQAFRIPFTNSTPN
ncbi:hypothetical protein NEHOM01_2332 [Nematocida homosporus]|uniref:uncharacterized protein n=1 Tax=Nematocida homosporus TaxID=1912981 RepID=UPI00221F95AD|nr:uncharacterized protein NEHOM01_2332 [Nematocida homosporus]KAI5187738.1 hypothetical protein NEHOM01_2332 [Nematocida homosporus]